MAETKSLKAEILERLNLHKGGQKTASANIRKASHDFAHSDAPQFKGRSQKKRHEMAVAAGLSAARGESAAPKSGDKAIYEGKNVIIRSLTETGMAVVRFGNNREVIVRAVDLKPVAKEQLTEAFLGMAPIAPTWREPTNYGFMKLPGLDPEDIGLIYEDDDTGEQDEQEEDHDNGSNVRHDGHTGKTEVDNLPTPSDTIAPAYSDKKSPKEVSSPLSIHAGAEEEHLWDEPEWDGYDYPADAPEIPTADFEGEDGGNARAPHFDSEEHQPGDRGEDYHDDDEDPGEEAGEDGDDEDRTDESYVGFDKLKSKIAHKGGVSNPGAVAAAIGRKKYGEKKFQHAAATGHKLGEGEVTDPARKNNSKDLAKMRKDIDVVSERRFGDDDDQQAQKEKGPKWQGNKDRGRARQQKEKERMGWMDESIVAERQTFGDDDEKSQQKEKGPKWQGNKDRGRARQQKEKERMGWMDESFFMSEMDAMLGGEDTEPKSGDTITVTLPAMAAIVCTVAHKVGHDHNLLKAIVEALAEVSKGKTIDVEDLQAVAAHINGEEMPEMENRDAGRPDHEGIHGEEGEAGGHNDGSEWPGDMEKTKSGKNKLLDCGNPMQESNYFNGDDVMEGTQLSEEDELRMLKLRAGLRFW